MIAGQHAWAENIALGLLLAGTAGCSSFDPVPGTRFQLLNEATYEKLQMPGAHWAAYDDQHSTRFQCTNGAAGDHDPSECSTLLEPMFTWDGPRCKEDRVDLASDLKQGAIAEHQINGVFEPICIRGWLRPRKSCVGPGLETRCQSFDGTDASNMWGAGVGLTFSADGTTGWNAESHHVKGVAFELSGTSDTLDKLRVVIPTLLDATTPVPKDRPLIRADGTIVATDGIVYNCHLTETDRGAAYSTLGDVNTPDSSEILTSDQHPNASPFWQPYAVPSWSMSPTVAGQNRFDLSEVLPPPSTDTLMQPNPGSYPFTDKTRILGIHFQVAQPKKNLDEAIEFSLCIKNLAFILE